MPANAEFLADALEARPSGRGRWMAKCPAHDDRTESLRITEKDDGNALIYCFAGCDFKDMVSALESQGLWEKTAKPKGPPPRKIRWAQWVVTIFEDNKRNGRYVGGGQYEPWEPSRQDRYDYGKAKAILKEAKEVGRA